MREQGTIKVKGKVILRDDQGRILAETDNIVVDSGLDALIQAATGLTTMTPYYAAVGTGTTTPSPADTTLAAEHYREVVTSTTAGTTTGQVVLSTFFLASNVTVYIHEVGLFGGTGADQTNGGTLIARALLDYDNSTGAVNITLDWVLTISR